ncbi:MAG: L-2-amino-thiazoline-4-carboxylic acid hydrolase [Clostridiales bacterium]|jgi:hypothetical protein|nr:L-2-amino-thiazoline-4-carboxylic acid hydrolase [Clostridiales bacterium]
MSEIKNEAHIKNPLVRAVREQFEHRALWLYFLCDEAKRKGLDPDSFAPAAISRCGRFNGANLVKQAQTTSLKGLRRKLFSTPARWMFEIKVRNSTDDRLELDFHYCPLVKAWQKQGCSAEEIGRLCDFAMCGDGGIAEQFGCTLELPQTIAHGDDICAVRFVRKKEREKE